WRFEPRAEYGAHVPRMEWRCRTPVAVWANNALAVSSWNAGTPQLGDGSADAAFEIAAGGKAIIALTCAVGEPLVLPGRGEVLSRLERTCRFRESWTRRRAYAGPWGEAVRT